jgi:hypothetical protein
MEKEKIMSFRIFASGSKGFHYVKNNFIDGKEFDAMKLYSTLAFLDHSPAGVVDAGLGHVSPGITDLMVAQANIVFVRRLKQAVDILATQTAPGQGWITVFSKEKHALWADDTSFNEYRFYPGDNPGTEFIKKIVPGLKHTDMDNFGVLMALWIVLSKYKDKLKKHDRPMINIQLTK